MIPIPTIQELTDDIIASIEAEYGIVLDDFGKNILRAIAVVQAGKLKVYYLAIANLQKNIFADTAETELIGGTLERFGRVKLGRNPFTARAGIYQVKITGSIGAIIPASTTFKSDNTSLSPGKLFILDAAYTLISSTDHIILRALEVGTESKLNIGNTLTSTVPLPLVNSSATVEIESTQPLAVEGIEDYRKEVLNSYRLEAQGGAATDYRLWSQDAQGVKAVYPYAKSGFPSQVNLYVEANLSDSIDGKGTPSAAMLSAVESVVDFNPDTTLNLNERGRRPLTVIVNYIPVTIVKVDVVIVSYVGLTPTIQSQLTNAITAMVNAIRPFVAAADILSDKNDILDLNRIINAVLTQTPGAVFAAPILKINNISLQTFTFMYGDIPYLNSVTYV